jgi:hypothetical protein
MNRTHNLKNTTKLAHQEISRKIAIHEAGHAASRNLSWQPTKRTELFLAAFNFVSKRPNWLAITALADSILAHQENIIECNEIIDVLESGRCRMATSQSIADFR